MKKSELNKLREKKASELTKVVFKNKQLLAETSAKMSVGKESNFKKAKNLRVDIAQILTILREKELTS